MKMAKTKDEVKIKDRDKLIKIFRAISCLDDWRWNKDNKNIIKYFRPDLTNCEKILTHWICYITDRQMPFEKIWDNGVSVFSELAYEYSREKELSPQQVLESHCLEQPEKEGKRKLSFKSTNNEKKFASRYVTNDKDSILQTLEILNNQQYTRNIVLFIIDLIRRFKDEDKNELLVRIACGLHLLTYTKEEPSKIIEVITDDDKFEKRLKEFKNTSTINKKRLWCCIRDYKKGPHHKIFEDAVKEASSADAEELIGIWNELPMNKIELPGDVWNNSPIFRDNLFANVLDIVDIPKTWGMPEIIRNIYERLAEDNKINDFYPEQFDITFSFVPRMCSKKLCNVCIFGGNGVEKICIPTSDKYCPVALVSCGYMAKCVAEDCILKKGITKGICETLQND